ncbi:TetR/AcrR family transcriptional regulator [Cryobacterium sp. W22_MBD10_FK3]|uniref:TetR/AcrR family transcriptional regulator n=1 Tax=Cryobacterium sp. W22_MBD10_FK3 TaxID=3240273 RepID=UPI003F928130
MTTRRYDPERADRIIDATLDLIAEQGLAGATYRTVADAAGVPLGSMTYHFPSRGDLLFAAFSRFADVAFTPLDDAMADPDEDPREQLVRIVLTDEGLRDRILLAELYVLSFREERYAELSRDWMRRARDAISPRVNSVISASGVSPAVLDAVQEGLGLHRYFLPEEYPESVVRATFDALIPAADTHTDGGAPA